jgi:hypothetical protein
MGGQIAPAATLPSFVYGYFSPAALNWCYSHLLGGTADDRIDLKHFPARIVRNHLK